MATDNLINFAVGDKRKSLLWRSFAAAWLVCNWKIFVVLFFEDSHNIVGQSYVEYIQQEHILNWVKWVVPAGISLMYIFGLVIVDDAINYWHEKRKVEYKNKVDKLKDLVLPTKAEYEELKGKDNSKRIQLEDSERENNEKQRIISQQATRLEALDRRYSIEHYFPGSWIVEHMDGKKAVSIYYMKLQNGQIFLNVHGTTQMTFSILYFDYEPDGKLATLFLENTNSSHMVVKSTLHQIEDDCFTGNLAHMGVKIIKTV